MGSNAEIIKSVDRDFWYEVATACDYATFFHSPLWHEIAARADSELHDQSIGVVFDDGTRAVLPLIELEPNVPGVLRNYVSSFAMAYGGIIADGPLPGDGVQQVLDAVLRFDAYRVEIHGNPLRTDRAYAEMTPEEDFTHILSLEGDIDDIISDMSRGHRSSYNKAQKEGVEVRPAESDEDWRTYYGAYEASLERWGDDVSSVYSWSFFETMRDVARDNPDNIRLWLAEVDGELASGAVVFYWNRHADYWHGAAHEEYFDQRPNNLLHVDIMADAIERGFDFYDFNPSGGHEGVANFKSRFGSEKREFERWKYKNPVADGVEKLGQRIFGDKDASE